MYWLSNSWNIRPLDEIYLTALVVDGHCSLDFCSFEFGVELVLFARRRVRCFQQERPRPGIKCCFGKVHGRRGDKSPSQLAARVVSEFDRHRVATTAFGNPSSRPRSVELILNRVWVRREKWGP